MRKRRKKLLEFWKNLRTFVQFFQTFLFFYFFAYTLFSKKFDSSLEVVCRCSTTRYWVWWMVNRRGLLFQWPTTSLTCSSFLGLQCSISVIAGSPRGSSAPVDGDAGVNAAVSCTPVEVRSTTGPPCHGDHHRNQSFSTGLSTVSISSCRSRSGLDRVWDRFEAGVPDASGSLSCLFAFLTCWSKFYLNY